LKGGGETLPAFGNREKTILTKGSGERGRKEKTSRLVWPKEKKGAVHQGGEEDASFRRYTTDRRKKKEKGGEERGLPLSAFQK